MAGSNDDTVPDRTLDSSMGISTVPNKGLHGDDTVPDRILDSSMGISTTPNKGLHGDDMVPDRILDSSMGISAIPNKGLHGDDTVPDNILDSGMGTDLAPSKGLQGEGSNLDSSMGIGPTSHKSLASNEAAASAAASAAAPVSQKNLSGLGSAGESPHPAQIGIFTIVHIDWHGCACKSPAEHIACHSSCLLWTQKRHSAHAKVTPHDTCFSSWT